ncbi:hypothetical protein ACWCQL_36955 [Streptomyces sp. NPDC002073]|uniref:hypothetical protein n=1 Tax=Streptomyces sp. NBC_00239 TaxID=2903640 RepID=UPI002E29B96B|nr:hypothetical protein [Streptomyces sp. NBC_00239]
MDTHFAAPQAAPLSAATPRPTTPGPTPPATTSAAPPAAVPEPRVPALAEPAHHASTTERGSFCTARCSCGWRGPARRSRDLARKDAAAHNTHPA